MSKAIFPLLLAIFFTFSSAGQDREAADSLEFTLANTSNLTDSLKANILRQLIARSSEPDKIIEFSEKLLQIDGLKDPEKYIRAYIAKGVAFRMKGHLKASIENLLEGAKFALQLDRNDLVAEAYVEIATTYMTNSDLKNALNYDKKAISIFRKGGSSQQLAINLLNTGYTYFTMNQYDTALILYNEAELIFDSIRLDIGKAYTIGNRALIYLKRKDYSVAEVDLLKAIEMLVPLGDEFGMSDYHINLGKLYHEQGYVKKALHHTLQALEMAKNNDLKEQIRDASLLLSELYLKENDFKKALEFKTQYIAFKDSIESAEKTKEMADLRTEFEVSLKEKEIDLLENERELNRVYFLIAVILLIFSIMVLLYFRQRFLNTRLVAENQRKLNDEKIENLLRSQETRAMQSMVVGREEERKRIAQELHNHFGSLLATIKVNLNGIEEEALPNYKTLTTLVDQACNDVRGMSHSLNMGISDEFGLAPALKDLVSHLRQSGGIEADLSVSMMDYRLDSEVEILVYRIVQELVSNVLKHAQASRISISLTCFDEENLLNVIVSDNGRGFKPESANMRTSGMGLSSIKQMVKHLGGEISFDSNPASGTTVVIDLPITKENARV